MGSTGQIIGGLAGAVIGAVGSQNYQGAFIGFSLGMLIGSAIDPPRGERSAINYKKTNAYGNFVGHNTPVPIVYGVNRVGGNLLWMCPTGTTIYGDESGKEGKGGGSGGGGKKGGSGGNQRALINMDWAIALSEGEITAIADVFFGDKIASITDGFEYSGYLGTQSQTADSRLTRDLQTLAPAFRNLAYVAISAELETPSLPTVNAEISGILGTPVMRNQNRYQLGYNAFAGDALELSDGSLLGLTHAGEELYRSTNRGETWFRVASGLSLPTGYIANAALGDHQGVPGRVYAAIYTYLMGNVRVYRSDDYGATWPNTSAPMVEAFDAGTVTGVMNEPDNVLFFSRGVGPFGYTADVWRSEDGGDNFSQIFRLTSELGWFGGVIATVQPKQGTIYGMAGGMGAVGAMLHSADGGRSWDETEILDYSPVQGGGWAYNDQIFGFGCNTSSGGAVYMTGNGGGAWYGFKVCDDQIGAMKMNSFGLLVAATSGTAWYSTTLGTTWHRLHVHTIAQPVIIPWGGPTAMWLTTDQVCFGGGSPAYVTCVDFTVPTSCGNPALIIKDLLTNNRYGLGLDEEVQIDQDSFVEASAYCIAQVPSRLSSGHVEQRFCLDYVVDNQTFITDHLRDMLATFGGYLCFNQGRIKLKIDQPTSCTQSFGMEQIVASTFSWRKFSYRERPNIIHVDYIEPGDTTIDATAQSGANPGRFIESTTRVDGTTTAGLVSGSNYKTYQHDFVEASDIWDIERTGERREKTLNLSGIKRRSQAQRMAEYYLSKSVYCQHACTFRVGIGNLKSEVGDVVAVSHDIPRWAGKLFRLVEIQEAENDELTLGCVEYNDAVFRAVPGLRPGQDPIEGESKNLFAAPYHVARLTAYERPYEDTIEINYTRIATQDLFGGVSLFKRIGETGNWTYLRGNLSLAPTAFLTSHVQTITLVES